MATNVAPGQIKKEVTYTEILPNGEGPDRKRQKRTPIWDFLPTISGTDWDPVNGRYEIHLYRYNPATEKRMAIEKVYECIDPFWVRKKYGGGSFNVLVKEDKQIIYNEDFQIEGEPIIASASSNGNGTVAAPVGADSVAIQAMRMAMNPDIMRSMFEMFKMASMESMAMIRAQMPAAQDPLQTLKNAKDILGIGAATPPPPNPMDDLMRNFMTAMMTKMMNPPETNTIKDTIALVSQIKEAGFLGAGREKTDLATSFISTLPSLLDKAVNGLHEYRLQSEANVNLMRLQHGEMAPGDPNVITVNPAPQPAQQAQPPAQPAPQPQPVATSAQTVSPEVQQQVIIQYTLNRMVAAIRQPNATGADMYDFLLNTWPEILQELAQMNKDTLLMFFKSPQLQQEKLGNAILYQVANDPRLPKMLDEFFAAAAEAKKYNEPPKPLI